MTRYWLIAGTACILLCRDAAAQTTKTKGKTKPCADSTTTKSGVYTAAQAARGSDVYAGNCKSCHTPETHTGPAFHTLWNKRPLSELYAYIRDRMPKNDPGSLSPEEYADVLAYMLRLNRMPSGSSELSTDESKLKSIRIESTKSQ